MPRDNNHSNFLPYKKYILGDLLLAISTAVLARQSLAVDHENTLYYNPFAMAASGLVLFVA